MGLGWSELDLVFGNYKGDPVEPGAVMKAYHRTMKKLGLSQVSFHDLRHINATLILKQGIHPKIVSEQLGRPKTNITLDTYSHVLHSMQEKAALFAEDDLQDSVKDTQLIKM